MRIPSPSIRHDVSVRPRTVLPGVASRQILQSHQRTVEPLRSPQNCATPFRHAKHAPANAQGLRTPRGIFRAAARQGCEASRTLAPCRLQDIQPARVSFNEELLGSPSVQKVLQYFGKYIPLPEPEDLVTFRYDEMQTSSGSSSCDPRSLGMQARHIIDPVLPQTGALLFHGLPITDPEACSTFVKALDYKLMKYEPYMGPRMKIGDLDAATNIPPATFLDLHNEMSYNPHPNRKIMLICLSPAEKGGESLLGSGARILAALPPAVVQRFEAEGGVRYNRLYQGRQVGAHSGGLPMSWQQRTGSSSREGAEEYWRALGCNVEWKGAPTLEGVDGNDQDCQQLVWNIQPAVVPHPVTGQLEWFNLAHMGMVGTTYASGKEIEAEVMEAIVGARMAALRALPLGAGDMLVLDNYRWLHGRMPYSGSSRKMVTVLTED